MSSFARAERRRQERAAAKAPAERDGLRLVYQDENGPGGDCLNAAVASVLGLDLADTAATNAYDPAVSLKWRRWADERGLIMRQNLTHAPAWLDEPWIAVVVGQSELHAVVMRRGRMIFNPSAGSPQQAVGRRDVQAAMIVGEPAWVEATSARTLELLRAGDSRVWALETPTAAAWHRQNGRELQARAIERNISQRTRVAA